MTAGSSQRVTVVVVNYNGAHLLAPCLLALRAQDLEPGAFTTVVVDNASRDGSLALLERDFPEVRVVANTDNRGFAGGNNSALRDVTTPYAALLNNDAVPEPGWLRELLAPFDAPGGQRIGMTTGKVVFLPRFLRLRLATAGFTPGAHDSRDLGVRVHSIEVDGVDVTTRVLWERLTFGREGPPGSAFWWTRPAGELLVPVPAEGPVTLRVTWAAEVAKAVALDWDGGTATLSAPAHDPATATLELPADAPRVDVVNNVGGVVLTTGYGADRGYQAIDDGRFDDPAEVFAGCGNGMALRSSIGHAVGWFDEDFFLYYEDTDLSWRVRARGFQVRYVPTAVLRHHHAATSGEWSPLFVFHTDRNRLLMLTKDATATLALREVPRYAVTTVALAARLARSAAATRTRPALRPLHARLRVVASYLRLLPVMLHRRRGVTRTAAVGRGELERLLVTHASWTEEAA